jgi:hypothetical protein
MPAEMSTVHYTMDSTPEKPRQLPKNLILAFNQAAEADDVSEKLPTAIFSSMQTLELRLEQIDTYIMNLETSTKAHMLVLEGRISAVEDQERHRSSQPSDHLPAQARQFPATNTPERHHFHSVQNLSSQPHQRNIPLFVGQPHVLYSPVGPTRKDHQEKIPPKRTLSHPTAKDHVWPKQLQNEKRTRN